MRVDGPIFAMKAALDTAAVPLYRARGRPPWSPGYITAKRRAIEDAIDRNLVRKGCELPPYFGVALDERVVEYAWLFDQLMHGVRLDGRFLDAGSALNHPFLLRRHPLRGLDLTIMTLAPEKWCQWYDGYSYVFGDLRNTYFRDCTFDVIVSVSTIEHIGLDNTVLYTQDKTRKESDHTGYLAAAREFRRLLKPGGVCLLSAPFGKHVDFGWYQVFDRRMVERLVAEFDPATQEVEYFGYAADGWRRIDPQVAEEADDFGDFPGGKQLRGRAAASRSIVCLRLGA